MALGHLMRQSRFANPPLLRSLAELHARMTPGETINDA